MRVSLGVTVLGALVSVCGLPLVSSRLLSSTILSRHGTRAPNPVVEQLCPADEVNLQRYHQMDISLAGLTANGMKEMLALGQATHGHYVERSKFISPYFDNSEVFVQAVAEDRTLQSAIAWGQGVFSPDSTPGYSSTYPVPLPVYSIPAGKDNLLEARKGACKQRLKHDTTEWDNTYGKALWSSNDELLSRLGALCRVNLKEVFVGSGDNYGDAIKDITDALMFDYQEHFIPLPGLTLSEFEQFRRVAITQLLGRIVGTSEQRTYMNGELPDTLINNMRGSLQDGGLRLIAYHGHREMMYAIAAFFGIDFKIPFPGLPHRAIPPATTLFVELHQKDGAIQDAEQAKLSARTEFESILQRTGYKPGNYGSISGNSVNVELPTPAPSSSSDLFVRILLWVPCYANSSVEDGQYVLGSIRHGDECPLEAVPLSACGGQTDCPLTDFIQIIAQQEQSTGGWATLCQYTPTNQLMEQLSTAQSSKDNMHAAVSVFSIGFAITFIAAATFAALLYKYRQSKIAADMDTVLLDDEESNEQAGVVSTTNSVNQRVTEHSSLLANKRRYSQEDSLP